MEMLSNQEIAKYLFQFVELQEGICLCRDFPLSIVFNTWGKYNGDYVERILKMANTQVYIDKFSMVEDFLLNVDDCVDENVLESIREFITVEPADTTVDTKRIVRCIRNAFNHPGGTNSKYEIAKDLSKIVVDFKDMYSVDGISNENPTPLRVTILTENLDMLCYILGYSKTNFKSFSIQVPGNVEEIFPNIENNMDEIKYAVANYTNKLSKSFIKNMHVYSHLEGKSKEEREIKTKKYREGMCKANCFNTYDLNEVQREKIISKSHEIFEVYNMLYNDGNNSQYLEMIYNKYKCSLMNIVLNNIPIPAAKIEMYNGFLSLLNSYFNILYQEEFKDDSLNGMFWTNIDLAYEKICGITDPLSPTNTLTTTQRINYSMWLSDREFMIKFPKILFIEFVVINMCNDNKIEINGNKYNKTLVRNSLVHKKWIISANDELVLYDGEVKNTEDMNIFEVGRIPLDDLYNYALEKADILEPDYQKKKNIIINK